MTPQANPESSLAYYLTGATTAFASQIDQRFSYYLYVPARRERDPERYPLVVIQHGTGRTAEQYRDAMAEWAERERIVILAPLFPAGIGDQNDLHNFKFLDYRGIRFDLILLGMVDEVGQRVPVITDKFLLHGFSGGGQFTHRFFYAHPERLRAISIGAPGRLTMLDDSTPWWLGTQDFMERFGKSVDIEAMRRVRVHMVVGSLDTEGWEINNPGDSNWTPGLEKQGATRIERLRNLRSNYAAHGIDSEFDLVDGVAHDGAKVLRHVARFFSSVLNSAPE